MCFVYSFKELEVDFHCGTSMNQRYLRDAAGDDSDYIEGINLGFDLNLTGPFEYGMQTQKMLLYPISHLSSAVL